MTAMNYRDALRAKRLVASQTAKVRNAYADLEEAASSVTQMARWALDQDDKDHSYYFDRAIEYAHELIDLAYAYRDAVKQDGVYVEPQEPDGHESPSQS